MLGKRFRRFALGVVLGCAVTPLALLGTRLRVVYSGRTAHEWGTFTSIAGVDGRAVEWSPLTGSTDLPGFVEQFQKDGYKLGFGGSGGLGTARGFFFEVG